VVTKSGKIRWILDRGNVVAKDKKGVPLRSAGILQDITEQKVIQDKLRKSRDRTELALMCAELGMWDWDYTNDKVTLDDRGYNVLGFTPVTSEDWYRHIHPDDVDQARAVDLEIIINPEKSAYSESRYFTDKDELRWLRSWGRVIERSPDGKSTRAIGVIQDITSAKAAEEKIKEFQSRMELALSGANMGLWDWNLSSAEETLDERAKKILGLKTDKNNFSVEDYEMIHPDDRKKINKMVRQVRSGQTQIMKNEFRIITKTGEIRWAQDLGKIVRWHKNGKPLRMSGIVMDITDRKQLEVELKTTLEALEDRVEKRTEALNDSNIALKILLEKHNIDKQQLENMFLSNIKELVEPHIEALKKSRSGSNRAQLFEALKASLDKVTSPLIHNLNSKHLKLTPTELQIINFIRHENTSKEIGVLLNISKIPMGKCQLNYNYFSF